MNSLNYLKLFLKEKKKDLLLLKSGLGLFFHQEFRYIL